MAGVAITYDLDQFAAYCGKSAQELGSMSFEKPLKVSRLIIIGDIREQFAGSHGPDGTPWPPLKFRDGQPLRDKGLLLAAWTVSPVTTITRDSMTLENNLDYAAPQHFGATIHKPERTRGPDESPWVFTGEGGETVFTRRIKEHTIVIPARPVGVSDGAADRIGMAFAEHVMGVL